MGHWAEEFPHAEHQSCVKSEGNGTAQGKVSFGGGQVT